jgi:hypothetical protein
MTRLRVLFGLAAVAVGVGLWFALTDPPDALQGVYSRLIMSDTVVFAVAFVVSYAFIVGYAVHLHLRSRSAGS